MLLEYAATPDVFDEASYSNAALARLYLAEMRRMFMDAAIIRDLRHGGWSQELDTRRARGRLCPAGAELLKKMRAANRLARAPVCLPSAPENDRHWLEEAELSHGRQPLRGIIMSHALTEVVGRSEIRASVEQLRAEAWWQDAGQSLRLDRTVDNYAAALRPVLQNARSLMFIDPFCGPVRAGSDSSLELIVASRRPDAPQPLIEVHRVCYDTQGQGRTVLSEAQWREEFERSWSEAVAEHGLTVKVFIWDDFHDRYLISDLIGVSMPYGFVTTKARDRTTWTRLARGDKDDVQREFDPASNMHALRGRFTIA